MDIEINKKFPYDIRFNDKLYLFLEDIVDNPFELFSYLEKRRQVRKERGQFIKKTRFCIDGLHNLWNLVREFGSAEVATLIPSGQEYYIECSNCEDEYDEDDLDEIKKYFFTVSKSNLMERLRTADFECPICKAKRINAIRQNEKEERDQIYETGTRKFIEEFLVTDFSYNKKEFYQIWRRLSSLSLYSNVVKEAVQKIGYKDFLKTLFWNLVSNRKRYKAGFKCQLCNNSKILHVHHKTYEHHGLEHLYLDDLIVLCSDCHEKFHDKGVYDKENSD